MYTQHTHTYNIHTHTHCTQYNIKSFRFTIFFSTLFLLLLFPYILILFVIVVSGAAATSSSSLMLLLFSFTLLWANDERVSVSFVYCHLSSVSIRCYIDRKMLYKYAGAHIINSLYMFLIEKRLHKYKSMEASVSISLYITPNQCSVPIFFFSSFGCSFFMVFFLFFHKKNFLLFIHFLLNWMEWVTLSGFNTSHITFVYVQFQNIKKKIFYDYLGNGILRECTRWDKYAAAFISLSQWVIVLIISMLTFAKIWKLSLSLSWTSCINFMFPKIVLYLKIQQSTAHNQPSPLRQPPPTHTFQIHSFLSRICTTKLSNFFAKFLSILIFILFQRSQNISI